MVTRLDLLRRGWETTKSNSIDAVFLRNKQTANVSEEDLTREPYKKSDLVYICISTTAKAISQVPLFPVKITGPSGQYKPLPLSDPWMYPFLRPNYITDRYTFVESIVTHLLHDGEVFVIPYPPGLYPPKSFWVVRNKYIQAEKDPKTNLLVGWWYNPSGMFPEAGGSLNSGTIPLDVNEVARIFLFNPYDPLKGMSPLEAGKISVIVDYKASFYTSVFFDEGASPGGIITTEQKLGDKQYARAKEQFEARHKGYKKSHRVAILEQGLKYTQTGLSQKDMEFGDLRKLTAERIYQIFGMKKAIVSVTEDINYATAREERKEWWEGTNLPIMSLITSALNFVLFPPESSLKLIFDITTVAALKEALKEKVDTGYKLWQMGFTADEVNERLDMGFGSKPWRKRGYIAVNIMPVDQYLDSSENGDRNPPTLPPPKHPKQLSSEENKDARDEHIWNAFIHRLNPLENSFAKKVSRVFSDMRNKTLQNLYKNTKTPKDIEDDNYFDDIKKLNKFTDSLYGEAILVGVTSITEETGSSIAFDLTDPEAISFLTNKNIQIRGIIQTIKDQIRVELLEAYEKGESIDQIADRIRRVFNASKSRAVTIARTEIVGTANAGRAVAINRSGFREKEWLTAGDEKVRLQHIAMHGVKAKVGESWVTPDGSSLRHPGDPFGPAHQIINCRCVEVVVPGTHYLNG